ncbi:hypothetical protein [Streptomyces ardesiacus]|uniref:hypothetical protein n=1 Tax=Streptomyces ardesiacus TaxID=285564 RepID=UPI0036E622A4
MRRRGGRPGRGELLRARQLRPQVGDPLPGRPLEDADALQEPLALAGREGAVAAVQAVGGPKYAQRGKRVEIVGPDEHSTVLRERLAGTLTGSH